MAPPARALRAAALRSWAMPHSSRHLSSLIGILPTGVAHEPLELLDGTMDQNLRGPIRAAQRTGDLAIVHAEREAHDQRLAPILRQPFHSAEHAGQLLAPLHQLL